MPTLNGSGSQGWWPAPLCAKPSKYMRGGPGRFEVLAGFLGIRFLTAVASTCGRDSSVVNRSIYDRRFREPDDSVTESDR